jgi:hypothetical protein
MITIALLSMLTTTQSPEDRARAALTALLTNLDVPLGEQALRAEISAGNPVKVNLTSDHFLAAYDSGSDRITYFQNLKRVAERMKGTGRTGTTMHRTEAEWIQYSRKYTQRLWHGNPLFADTTRLDPERVQYPQGFDGAGKILIEWTERPNGYQARSGNGLSLTLDTQDGAVLGLVVKVGFTYGSAQVGITEQQAVSKAIEAVSGKPGAANAQPRILDLAYIIPRANVGGPNKPPVKRCELAYVVSFGENNGVCHVAAKDGAILGVGWVRIN